jgi:hypothetical protein
MADGTLVGLIGLGGRIFSGFYFHSSASLFFTEAGIMVRRAREGAGRIFETLCASGV